MADATASAHALKNLVAEHAVTVLLGGRTMGTRDAKVCLSLYPSNFIRVLGRSLASVVYADVDECKTNNGGCHSARACSNTAGGRTCGNCGNGWTNNGATDCDGEC